MNNRLKKALRPGMVFILVGILASALALGACSASAQTETEAALSTETGQVSLTTYVDTYETTGAIAARDRTAVSWTTTGTIAEVMVELGDMVKAGDVLMTIDPASVSTSLDAAYDEIDNAQAALDALMAPDTATVAAAGKTLAAAVASWRDARASLTTQLKRYAAAGDYGLYIDFYNADAALTDAMNGLNLAGTSLDVQMAFQAARSVVLRQAAEAQAAAALAAKPDNGALQQRTAEVKVALVSAQAEADARLERLSEEERADLAALQDALAAYEAAVNDFVASFDGDTAFEYAARISSLDAAWQEAGIKLDSAILDLYALVREPDADAYADAAERLANAELKLQDIQDGLNLKAPVDGEVISVNFEAGDEAKLNANAVDLIDRKNLYLTLSIEESRIMKLVVGDPVALSIEVMPDVQLNGYVAYINPVGTSSQGVVYYTVRVDIEQPAVDVLIGATADVAIQLGEPREVFTVPVLAVQNDTEGEYVYRMVGGQYERVTVVSGLILADDTVVVEGGLQAGDTVAIFTSTASSEDGLGVRVPGMGGVVRP